MKEAGTPGVSVIEIHPVGYGYEANRFAPHGAPLVDRYRYLAIVSWRSSVATTRLTLLWMSSDPGLHGQSRGRDGLRVGRRRCRTHP